MYAVDKLRERHFNFCRKKETPFLKVRNGVEISRKGRKENEVFEHFRSTIG